MSLATAIKILTLHSINYRLGGSWLEIEDVGTIDGVLDCYWIDCPTSAVDLYKWLGY